MVTPEASAQLLEQGIRAFGEGSFFLAHEFWEDLWRQTPSSAPERRSLQALVQIAVALHNLAAGRGDAAHRLLGRALAKLDPAMGPRLGIDLGRTRHDTLRAMASLERAFADADADADADAYC